MTSLPVSSPLRTTELDPRRWWLLAITALAQLVILLDITIVTVALPSAQAALDISDANRHWIVTAYAITFGGFLLLGGRLGDTFGDAAPATTRGRGPVRGMRRAPMVAGAPRRSRDKAPPSHPLRRR